MSPIESLYILVTLETDQLKKGLEDAQSQVKKLEHEFENLGRAGDNVSHTFDHVLRSAAGMFAGFASFSAILSGASGAVQGIRELGQASRELNVDVSALDAWGSAVARIGGSASGFQSSLSSLAQHFGTTNEIALRALPRLADAFSKLNPRQAQNYGKSLGLDQSTILLLQQGRREVEATIKQQKELGVVTKEQAENTRKFDMALYDASRAYQQFYRELATPILPFLTDALNYVILHKDAAVGSFQAIAVAVAALGVALLDISPLFRVAAAITAISAAYGILHEDIKAFQEGKNSATGDFLKKIDLDKGTAASVIKNPDIVAQMAKFSFGNIFSPYPTPILPTQGNTTVTIGDVNINTAATDADGIALHAANSLKKQIGQAISQVDNGVSK